MEATEATKPKILIIDDDRLIAKMVSRYLAEDYQPLTAASGNISIVGQAMITLKTQPDIKLVITDIELGRGEFGFQVIEQCVSNFRERCPPFIIMSGSWKALEIQGQFAQWQYLAPRIKARLHKVDDIGSNPANLLAEVRKALG